MRAAAGIGHNDGQAGDRVITTPFSFVASTNVLLYEDAIPVFVDVDQRRAISIQQAAQAAEDLDQRDCDAALAAPYREPPKSGHLKALLPVDVFGQPADFDPLSGDRTAFSLKVIEEFVRSAGRDYKDRPAGRLGDFGVFAFYPNKQITTGEGGMMVTDDERAAGMMRALRNQGRAPGDTWLQHTYLGYNYRLDEMSAALGAVQMKRLDELLDKRQQVAGWYQERLEESQGCRRCRWAGNDPHELVRLRDRLAERSTRDRLPPGWESCGIPVRPISSPSTCSPTWRKLWLPGGRLPGQRRPGPGPGAALLERHVGRAG